MKIKKIEKMTGLKNMKILERRLELLKMEGEGFFKNEIVQTLAKKYNCSASTIYYDFRERSTWQPRLQELKRLQYRIVNRYEQIYRHAAFKFRTSQNESIQIASLKVMSDTLRHLTEATSVFKEQPLDGDNKKEIVLRWWQPCIHPPDPLA